MPAISTEAVIGAAAASFRVPGKAARAETSSTALKRRRRRSRKVAGSGAFEAMIDGPTGMTQSIVAVPRSRRESCL
jgi:hypothetical protein